MRTLGTLAAIWGVCVVCALIGCAAKPSNPSVEVAAPPSPATSSVTEEPRREPGGDAASSPGSSVEEQTRVAKPNRLAQFARDDQRRYREQMRARAATMDPIEAVRDFMER